MGGAQSTIIAVLYAVAILAAVAHILLHKREPRSAALWLLLVAVLPVVGLVAYFLVGLDRVTRQVLRKEAANLRLRQEYAAYLPRSQAAYEYPLFPPRSETDIPELEFSAVIDRITGRPLLTGNRIKLMQLGDHVYQNMLTAIERAKRNVNLQTYIFIPDKVGRQIVEMLVRKAREGVEVRFIYDAVGSVDALWFLDELTKTGVRALPFAPLNPFKRRWQVNLRNHRKLLVVDGELAFTGGMNISEEHLLDHPLLTRVKDYHFQVEGPIVHQMQEWFVEDWYYASGEKLVTEAFFPALTWQGEDLARVVTSGPDNDYEAFYQIIFSAISAAKRRVVIVTPYFIPDKGLQTALQQASLRGVDITLLVPGHSDHPFITWAARTFYEDLLSFGVRIYERAAPFLHAKVMMVDEVWAIIGSANMDVRSFRLNFEANLEVRSPALIRALQAAIQDDIRASKLIDAATFRARGVHRRLLEGACGLFNPLL